MMETRNVEVPHIKVYILVLNTFGAAEDYAFAACSLDLDELKKFYNSQLLPKDEQFRDDAGFYHSFRQGPFYNLNPCGSLEPGEVGIFGHGVHEQWVPEIVLKTVVDGYGYKVGDWEGLL